MSARDFVLRLTEYFAGNYSPKVLERMEWFCRNIDEKHFDRLYEQIEQDNPANFKVSVKAIKDAAVKLDIAFYDPRERRWIKVTCDACEHEYKYFPCPTDEEMINLDMHHTCPRCGLPYNEQRDFYSYYNKGMAEKSYIEYYFGRVKRCLERVGEGKPWYFDKAANRRAIDEQKRREAQAIQDRLRQRITFGIVGPEREREDRES